ncbi:MAG TPA: hypothetical protein VNM69_06640 [Bacillus sp. (in: firmicutes)]|nr:hypothetical protein [Bacillus sp. (in: firmicutes)]
MALKEVSKDRFLQVGKSSSRCCYSCLKHSNELISINIHYEGNSGVSGIVFCHECMSFILQESIKIAEIRRIT